MKTIDQILKAYTVDQIRMAAAELLKMRQSCVLDPGVVRDIQADIKQAGYPASQSLTLAENAVIYRCLELVANSKGGSK